MQPIEILYLESRPGSGRSTARRLKATGFDVRTSALASLTDDIRSRAPDVVICELETASGAETLRAVKTEAPLVPVLVVGDKKAMALSRGAAELGVCRFLKKPVRQRLHLHGGAADGPRAGGASRRNGRKEFRKSVRKGDGEMNQDLLVDLSPYLLLSPYPPCIWISSLRLCAFAFIPIR
jgi:DNA-binding NtrC family response regulator